MVFALQSMVQTMLLVKICALELAPNFSRDLPFIYQGPNSVGSGQAGDELKPPCLRQVPSSWDLRISSFKEMESSSLGLSVVSSYAEGPSKCFQPD